MTKFSGIGSSLFVSLSIIVTGGAGLGASTGILGISIASPFHTTRVHTLASTLNTFSRQDTALQSGFQQLPPIVMSPTGTHHHITTAIFKSLSACGVDVVELKRSIAITMLKFRARFSHLNSNRAIYDAAKTPRSDVDYSLSPPPRSSARTACARSSAPSTPASTDPVPAPADWPMDTG